MQAHEIRRRLAKQGFVAHDLPDGAVEVTNNGTPKRSVTHLYGSWDDVERFLYLYSLDDKEEMDDKAHELGINED